MQVKDWSDRTLPADVVAWLDRHDDDCHPDDQLRHRANLARLWLLNEHGGWWVDHDVILTARLDTLPYPMAAAHGTLCSCVLGLPKQHPTLTAALEVVDANEPSDRRSPVVSGEALLNRLRTPDVRLLPLAYDASGRSLGGTWAVHLYHSKGNR